MIPDVALFSLTSETSYAGLGNDIHLKGWWVVVVSDLMEDIRSMILANAVDPETGIDGLRNGRGRRCWKSCKAFDPDRFENRLTQIADALARIPMKRPPARVPRISLTGEIFVRRDGLSRRYLTERLAEKGFATVCAPVSEWMHYCDYLVSKGINNGRMSPKEKLKFHSKRPSWPARKADQKNPFPRRAWWTARR